MEAFCLLRPTRSPQASVRMTRAPAFVQPPYHRLCKMGPWCLTLRVQAIQRVSVLRSQQDTSCSYDPLSVGNM